MRTVRNHYAAHLAPVYVWMAGGAEQAFLLGASDVAPFVDRPGIAVDLGAGFGMHSVPLARAGFEVLAVDSSPLLLAELRQHVAGLPVETVEADLLELTDRLRRPADLILCMGDTLTHLPSVRAVVRLIGGVARSLRPGGRFVATFRDYRVLPEGERRFIPVRSDADRILCCFLEARGRRVRVHDVLHERTPAGWSMRVSRYPKLRLSPEAVIEAAAKAGLQCRFDAGPRGMVRVIGESSA